MKAVVFDGKLKIANVPVPKTQEGEALVQIQMAGICNTDMEITKGYMDFHGILGHEFVGVVEQHSDSMWIGKRVVGEINLGCNHCPLCKKGDMRHCQTRSVLGIVNKDGVFADYVTLPVQNLHLVPDDVSNEEAVFVEPLAAACEILEQVHVEPSHRIAIVGDGKLAQLIARVLQLTGCHLTVFGKSQKKLSLLSAMSIDTRVYDGGPAERYDIVIEASGSPTGFQTALNLVRPKGIFVLKSTTHDFLDFNPARLVIDEIHLIGSRCGRFEPALRLLQKKLVDVTSLISSIYPIDQAKEAFLRAGEDDVLKVLFDLKKGMDR